MFQVLQAGAEEAFLGLGVVVFLLVLLVAVAILALGITVVVQAYKAGRSGWWVYLIVMFIGPLNLIAIVLWFAHWKKNPLMVGGKPFF